MKLPPRPTPDQLLGRLQQVVLQLSLEPESLKQILPGFVVVADELALDLEESHVTMPRLLEEGMVTADVCRHIWELGGYIDAWGDAVGPSFWDWASVCTHPGWKAIRDRARAVLQLIGAT